jgi:RNA polymerase sigma factor (sigma-70 family)
MLEQGYSNIHHKLIEGCRVNDRRSQTELYKLYYKAMYNTSFRIVNDAMEAEDIMQEAFLAAFGKIDTYSGQVSFGAWLKKIVVNRSLDALRKKQIYFDDVSEHMDLADEREDSSPMESARVTAEEIKAAIKNLADGYRIILSLYLLEGYDHEEISDILAISSSTSRSQYTRARRKLLEMIN